MSSQKRVLQSKAVRTKKRRRPKGTEEVDATLPPLAIGQLHVLGGTDHASVENSHTTGIRKYIGNYKNNVFHVTIGGLPFTDSPKELNNEHSMTSAPQFRHETSNPIHSNKMFNKACLEGTMNRVKQLISKGNMSTVNPFEVLKTEYTYVISNLELNGTRLLDHLYKENVLTLEQMEVISCISPNSQKVRKLFATLMKRPAHEFQTFMKGLERDQVHIKTHLQNCLLKASEGNATETDMIEDHEAMDQDTDEGGDVESDQQESTSSESDSEDDDSEEDSGQQLIELVHIKTADAIRNFAVRVTVVERDTTEVKSGQKQFMAVVADDTSAVDVCVRNNEDLFHKFKVGDGLILVNVDWSGYVLFANEKCTAVSVSPIDIRQHIIDEAFGQREAVPISGARTRPVKSFVPLRGKVVKQSAVTKEYAYGMLLMIHRLIKLKDWSGSVYIHVWGEDAVNLKAGDVIHITGGKIQKSNSEPEVTTTRKTRVEHLSQSGFVTIHIDRQFQTGTLEGIDVEVYKSCPKPGCYHFKLDLIKKTFCKSCEVHVTEPVPYATARIFVTTPRNRIRSLKVLWPQLCQLYSLFDIHISLESGKPTPGDEFRHLRHKTVQFQACGTVIEFRLSTFN